MADAERVIIVGAGPVGLISAIRLSEAGIPTVLCEAGPGLPHDLRASTWHPPTLDMMRGLDFDLWEIGIFYDNGGRTFGPLGWTPVTIFGRITENLTPFQEACRDIRWNGAKTVELGRAG